MEVQQIGPYRIVRLLGEGGMGAVYEAVHEQISRRAAVKVLHPHFAQNPQIVARFLNEARAVNLIEHKSLVQIYEFGQTSSGTPYIVMEYLRGESLGARLKRQGRLGHEALRVVRQIALGLHAAHQKGIVHRDLKPDNVMLVPDEDAPGGERVKILDFGIAKVAMEGDSVQMKTQTGALMGTPTYMAPEQCRGAGRVDEKADVYALGAILFHLLISRPPFVAEGMGELITMHIGTPPPSLRNFDPAIPRPLVDLTERMLGKAPASRPTMMEVAAEMEGVATWTPAATVPSLASAEQATVLSQPPSTLGGAAAESGTFARPRTLLGIGMGLVVLIIVCVVAWRRHSGPAMSAASSPKAPPVSTQSATAPVRPPPAPPAPPAAASAVPAPSLSKVAAAPSGPSPTKSKSGGNNRRGHGRSSERAAAVPATPPPQQKTTIKDDKDIQILGN